MKKILIKIYKFMTKIISKFKNSFTGEVYQIGAGEGGGATDPAIVEQIYADLRKEITDGDSNLHGEIEQLNTNLRNEIEGVRTGAEEALQNATEVINSALYDFQTKDDEGLYGKEKNLINAINSLFLRVNELEKVPFILYHDSFSLSIAASSSLIPYNTILKSLPTGSYTISSEWNFEGTTIDPYTSISLVAVKKGKSIPIDGVTFNLHKEFVLGVWDVKSGLDTTVKLEDSADLVVYLASKDYIEHCMDTPEQNIDSVYDVTATINSLKVIKV